VAVEVDPAWLGPYRPLHASNSKEKTV
jgi:hypothetical protein